MMSIFYLQINRNGGFHDPPALKIPNGLKEYFKFLHENIFFVVFASKMESDPRLIKNENDIIYIHGSCPNITPKNVVHLNELFGNFNIVHLNTNSKCVQFIKDFTNSFDAFLYEDCDKFIITNNPLMVPSIGLTIDYKSIAQYLMHYQILFPNNYFFKEIKKIRSGAILMYDKDKNSINETLVVPNLRYPIFEEFIEYFDSIIKMNLGNGSAEKICVDMTGGYDTRLVSACIIRNNIPFTACVYGEEDREVKFVRNMARQLGLDLVVLTIDEKCPFIINNWKYLFYLSGGYYNLFEVLKEGGRSILRSQYCLKRVTGGIGEILRDKWYIDKYHRQILNNDSIENIITNKTVKMFESMSYCTRNFQELSKEWLQDYRNEVRAHVKNNGHLDISQNFMKFMFEHYIQGWLGTIYNYQNSINTIVAPYMDNMFYLKCFYVNEDFRRNASGMTHAINYYHPIFSTIPFIDGQKCSELKGVNLAIYLVHTNIEKINKKLFNSMQKTQYRHDKWFNNMLNEHDFRVVLENKCSIFDNIIGEGDFNNLVKKASSNTLTRSEYDFLWKLISLKINIHWDAICF